MLFLTLVLIVASVGLFRPPASLAAPTDVLTVRAMGSTGQEKMTVSVAGTVLGEFVVTTEWAEYQVVTPSAAGAPDVTVAFVNDSVTPTDRNLRVDSVTYGSVTHQAEAEVVEGTGVWENGGRCRPGHHRSEWLACNGSLRFGDLPGVAGVQTSRDEASEVVIRAAGNAGRELLELRVDGAPVAVFQLSDSVNLISSPSFDLFEYHHPERLDPARIRVAFVNDRYENGVDYNVRVSWVDVDGERFTGERWTMDPAGVLPEPCRSRALPNEIMACRTEIALGESSAAPAPTTTTTAAPTTTASTTTPSTTAPTTTRAPSTSTSLAPATTSEPTTQPRPVPSPTPPTGQFYVVGSDIIDPDGNIFYPIGANVAIKFTPYGYVFEGNNGGVNDHLADVSAWNWNTIRATLICDNDSGVPTQDDLVAGIDDTIQRFTDAGIVVMLECHDLTGSDPGLGSAKDIQVRRFWDRMAARYGDNPYVWFNIYNEPYASDDTEGWTRLHRFYLDRIRAAGAENIVVADLPIWGQGIHLLAEDDFADDLGDACNMVFGWHAYGAISGQQGTVADHERAIRAVQAKDMALIVGEFGVASPANWGNAGPWRWNVSGFEAMSTLGPKYGIGLLWWHATGDQAYFSLYSLKNDRSGFWTAGNSGNLTPYGQAFWDTSQRAPHDLGPFTGDLADSNCDSVS